ncbi:hypothetical protein [Pseudomonas alloputida]|uniref:hypothetical protein n=1 Tax=Pseudomonas TaxID=286 RepID=UPI003EED88F2
MSNWALPLITFQDDMGILLAFMFQVKVFDTLILIFAAAAEGLAALSRSLGAL